MDLNVLLLLENSGLHKDVLDSRVKPHLTKIGIKTVEDLEFLKEGDIESINELTIIEKRKLLEALKRDWDGSALTTDDQSGCEADNMISIRYLVYGTSPLVGNTIDDIMPKEFTLCDLIKSIAKSINLADEETIELYSIDGYPLHNNCITNSVILQKWGLKDNFVFVLVRNKNQPRQDEFATLPALDHEIGEETFCIETPFHGKFHVNAYMDSDSPEDIAQKIFSLTDIPVPYMSLFVRRGYNQERLDPFTELQDNDIIRVVLRDPQELIHPQTTHYGCRTYNPLVTQTEYGISKFFSILKFLCCPQSMTVDYDFEMLLSYLLELTEFPPLVYSLRVLFEQSYLSISGWTAIVEGCYILFKEVISSFGQVPDNRVFELSDYVWSYFIEQSKMISDVSVIEFDQVSLVCPLSGTKILTPIRIYGIDGGPFDRDNVIEKIKNKECFSDIGFNQTGTISEIDLILDHEVNSLLLHYPWEHIRSVYKWGKNSKRTLCKKICVNIDCSELPTLLHNLSIVNPCGLYAGNECLTYIDNGRLVFFPGASKGDDEHRRIYDPVSTMNDYHQLIRKSKLDSFGRSNLEGSVSVDLDNITTQISNYNQERVDAIIKPHETAQWAPEEAIVVLLDYSGSMGGSIYPEIKGMRCIDVAKELFNAFITRTQAYRFHHCFGLTLFSTYVTVKLDITKNTEEFEMSLKGLEPDGRTSLTDAMINGITQLQHYNSCIRRIICLTDGQNTSNRYTYEQVLDCAKANDVIIDTVLLTGPQGNKAQTNISHQTGGVCVLPSSMNKALSFFEMDTMLSVRERKCSQQMHTGFASYNMYYHQQYETQDDLVSKLIEEFTKMKTTSAKRFSLSERSKTCQRRLLKELREIIQNPHPYFKVFPTYESFDSWKVLMKGPPASAYEKGIFIVAVKFPEKYPSVPPEIRFLTRIHHCNISRSSGRVCHAILGSGYTPATSMRDVLSYIYGLLMCPDIDTPLDSTLANDYGYLSHKNSKPFSSEFYFGEACSYFQEAERQVYAHANYDVPFEQLVKELDDLIK